MGLEPPFFLSEPRTYNLDSKNQGQGGLTPPPKKWGVKGSGGTRPADQPTDRPTCTPGNQMFRMLLYSPPANTDKRLHPVNPTPPPGTSNTFPTKKLHRDIEAPSSNGRGGTFCNTFCSSVSKKTTKSHIPQSHGGSICKEYPLSEKCDWNFFVLWCLGTGHTSSRGPRRSFASFSVAGGAVPTEDAFNGVEERMETRRGGKCRRWVFPFPLPSICWLHIRRRLRSTWRVQGGNLPMQPTRHIQKEKPNSRAGK